MRVHSLTSHDVRCRSKFEGAPSRSTLPHQASLTWRRRLLSSLLLDGTSHFESAPPKRVLRLARRCSLLRATRPGAVGGTRVCSSRPQRQPRRRAAPLLSLAHLRGALRLKDGGRRRASGEEAAPPATRRRSRGAWCAAAAARDRPCCTTSAVSCCGASGASTRVLACAQANPNAAPAGAGLRPRARHAAPARSPAVAS